MLARAAFVLVAWWATHGLLGRWGCALCVLTRYVCHPNQGEPVAAAFIKPSLGCPHAESAHTHIHMNTHSLLQATCLELNLYGGERTHTDTHTYARTHTTRHQGLYGTPTAAFQWVAVLFFNAVFTALSFTCGVKARCGLLWYTASSYHWTTGVNLEVKY